MSKILIASIGTGINNDKSVIKYLNATYMNQLNPYKYFVSPYLFRAAVEFYKIDRVILIGTVTSSWANLYLYLISGGNPSYSPTQAQYNILKALDEAQNKLNNTSALPEFPPEPLQAIEQKLPKGSKIILTKYGLNDAENSENFSILTRLEEHFSDGDELYFDITHSFRSLPMYQFLIIQYLRNISKKNIEIKNILYGMFEVRKEFDEKTPVVELNSLDTITQWMYAAYEFRTYGSTLKMEELLRSDALVEGPQKELTKLLKRINATLNFNQYAEFLETLRMVKACLAGTDLNALSPTVANILRNVFEEFAGYFNVKAESTPEYFQMEIAKLHSRQHRYGLSAVALIETAVTFICSAKKVPFSYKINRDAASNSLMITNGSEVYPNWCLGNEQAKNFVKLYNSIRKIRNLTSHFSTRPSETSILDAYQQLNMSINSFEKYIANEDLRKYIREKMPFNVRNNILTTHE